MRDTAPRCDEEVRWDASPADPSGGDGAIGRGGERSMPPAGSINEIAALSGNIPD
jgi:hypothetical protein